MLFNRNDSCNRGRVGLVDKIGPVDGLRVLFICEGNAETHDSWSGVSRSVIRHLREEGHEVQVGDADLYGVARLGVALRTLAFPRKRWWVRFHLHEAAFRARSAACARIVQRQTGTFDVVLQIGATFIPPESDATPLVLYCDSNIEMSRLGAATGQSEGSMLTLSEMAAIRQREIRVYRRAALIFTMSERLRRSFIEDFGIPAERLVTVHCGPNNEVPSPDQSRDAQPDSPTILFVGRDFQRKGGPLLLEAFDIVRRKVPRARLRVIGGRPDRRRDDAGIEYLGFLDRDTANGRESMDSAYRTATVFCIPTRFEPFGTSFVEAMTYGLPCVGPSAWAVPEIIAHDETGYLVPPDDAERLAKALIRVLSEPEVALRMSAAARERADKHFSWRAVAQRMSRAIEGLMLPSSAMSGGAG